MKINNHRGKLSKIHQKILMEIQEKALPQFLKVPLIAV
jgi:hypothetical protein